MTWRSESIPPVPETTAAMVRAAFPKGNLYVDLHAEFGAIYDDAQFAALYSKNCGRPVEVAPWRLALVTVMQYMEGLSDRQAADAVRRCMDWKYALSLELSDPGFNFTLLHDFRERFVRHESAQQLLDTLLGACKARGLIKVRGKQRTDSTHVLAAFAPSTAWNWRSKPCERLSISSVRPMRRGCVSGYRWSGMSSTVHVRNRTGCPKRRANATPWRCRLGPTDMP